MSSMKKALNPLLIVSLTSYGDRLNTLSICLKSLLNQTKKADKILVYLTDDIKESHLPSSLLELRDRGIEYRFVPLDLKPHKKYYYAMQEFPDDIIVTVDDDVIYYKEMLSELYKTYLKFPKCIVTGRAHEITFNDDGSIKAYDDWNWCSQKCEQSSMKLLATGAGSVLYPPHLLDKKLLFNLDYIKHYITVDDLWLKLVEVLSNVPTVVCSLRIEKMREGIPDTQAQGLFNKNVGKNENDLYLKDLDKKFSLASKILAYENGEGK